MMSDKIMRSPFVIVLIAFFILTLVTSCSNSNKSTSTTNTSNPQTTTSQKSNTTNIQQPSTPPTTSNNTPTQPAEQTKQPQQQVTPGTPETTTPSPNGQPGSANPGTTTQPGKEQEKKYTPIVGSYAPLFTTFTLDNKQISLDQFKGKTVILKFWASWCAKCQATAPELNKFYADHPDDVAIIAINLNQADTFDGINQYIQRYKITYPVAVDITGDISTLYRVSQTSTYFVIDPQGVIRQIFTSQTLKAKDFEMAYQKAQQPTP